MFVWSMTGKTLIRKDRPYIPIKVERVGPKEKWEEEKK